MANETTDQKLVKRVQKGDKGAFDLLVLKYQHKLLKLIVRYVRDQDEVQDIAQESFLKAYRALPNFRGDSAFYTWLYRIAINTAKNYLVSQQRRPLEYDLDAQGPERLEPEHGGAALLGRKRARHVAGDNWQTLSVPVGGSEAYNERMRAKHGDWWADERSQAGSG